MSWCPMKNSLQEERKKDWFCSFKPENGSQIVPPAAGLEEGKVLKAQVSLSRDIGIIRIVIPAMIVFIISEICFYGNFFLDIFPFFIMHLAFLALIFITVIL